MKEILDKYHDQGFEVAAFPCNQFGGQVSATSHKCWDIWGIGLTKKFQEPACEIDIKNFVNEKFHFEPDLYAKINVNGSEADPLYTFLKKEQGGTLVDAIKWNFTKFLVDRQGHVVKRFAPTTAPKDIVKDIEKLL